MEGVWGKERREGVEVCSLRDEGDGAKVGVEGSIRLEPGWGEVK